MSSNKESLGSLPDDWYVGDKTKDQQNSSPSNSSSIEDDILLDFFSEKTSTANTDDNLFLNDPLPSMSPRSQPANTPKHLPYPNLNVIDGFDKLNLKGDSSPPMGILSPHSQIQQSSVYAGPIPTTWIAHQLQNRVDEYASISLPLSISCCSWNVNGKKPSDDPLDPWLCPLRNRVLNPTHTVNGHEMTPVTDQSITMQRPVDIMVVSFQEIVDLSAKNLLTDPYATGRWEEKISILLDQVNSDYNQQCPAPPRQSQVTSDLCKKSAGYILLASNHLVGLAMCVWVKAELVPIITRVRMGKVGIGIMGVGGNKGAVGVSMMVGHTSICFLNAHIAAHQHKVKDRNLHYHAILQRLVFSTNKSIQCTKTEEGTVRVQVDKQIVDVYDVYDAFSTLQPVSLSKIYKYGNGEVELGFGGSTAGSGAVSTYSIAAPPVPSAPGSSSLSTAGSVSSNTSHNINFTPIGVSANGPSGVGGVGLNTMRRNRMYTGNTSSSGSFNTNNFNTQTLNSNFNTNASHLNDLSPLSPMSSGDVDSGDLDSPSTKSKQTPSTPGLYSLGDDQLHSVNDPLSQSLDLTTNYSTDQVSLASLSPPSSPSLTSHLPPSATQHSLSSGHSPLSPTSLLIEQNSEYTKALADLTIMDHDHIIWMGDLNYRLAHPSLEVVHKKIIQNDIPFLLQYDQLLVEKRGGRAFAAFEELPINFPPTYKYIPNTNTYEQRANKKLRMPSYTDRVQWCSLRNHSITPHEYVRSLLILSDHKPVRLSLSLNTHLIDLKAKSEMIEKMESYNALQVLPRVSISCSHVHWNEVRFNIPYSYNVTITNTGNSVVRYTASVCNSESSYTAQSHVRCNSTSCELQPMLLDNNSLFQIKQTKSMSSTFICSSPTLPRRGRVGTRQAVDPLTSLWLSAAPTTNTIAPGQSCTLTLTILIKGLEGHRCNLNHMNLLGKVMIRIQDICVRKWAEDVGVPNVIPDELAFVEKQSVNSLEINEDDGDGDDDDDDIPTPKVEKTEKNEKKRGLFGFFSKKSTADETSAACNITGPIANNSLMTSVFNTLDGSVTQLVDNDLGSAAKIGEPREMEVIEENIEEEDDVFNQLSKPPKLTVNQSNTLPSTMMSDDELLCSYSSSNLYSPTEINNMNTASSKTSPHSTNYSPLLFWQQQSRPVEYSIHVSAQYVPSIFGAQLSHLCTLNKPLRDPSGFNRYIHERVTGSSTHIPKELFYLVQACVFHPEGGAFESNQLFLPKSSSKDKSPKSDTHSRPFSFNTKHNVLHPNLHPVDPSLIIKLRDVLDTCPQLLYTIVCNHRIPLLALGHTLLDFLSCLFEPLMPANLALHVQPSLDLNTWCRVYLNQVNVYSYATLIYLLAFFRTMLEPQKVIKTKMSAQYLTLLLVKPFTHTHDTSKPFNEAQNKSAMHIIYHLLKNGVDATTKT